MEIGIIVGLLIGMRALGRRHGFGFGLFGPP